MSESLEMLEDWEDWDPRSGTTFMVHALAGSLAGASEHCAMYPIDTVKTHLQAARATGRNVEGPYQVVRSLVDGNLGVLRMWRGVSTMLTACVPAHAAYFSIFEFFKEYLGGNTDNYYAAFSAGLAGMIATLSHDAVMTPMDVAKQRLQLGFYAGPWDCLKTVVRTEGLASLYLSYPTTLLMNIPYAGVMVATNETVKKILNPRNENNIPAFMLSGAIAGGVAGFATNPLDVVKTRLQTQNLLNSFPNCLERTESDTVTKSVRNNFLGKPYEISDARFISRVSGYGSRYTYTARNKVECVCHPEKPSSPAERTYIKYTGLIDTIKRIHAEEGLKGFMRGIGSRVLVQAPSVAVSWTTYETAKKLLSSFS